MRKLLSVIIGTVLVAWLGYSSPLPPSFASLVDWFGPMFGTAFHVMLSMLYLFFTNDLWWIWLTAGLIIGLITRKLKAAITSSFLVLSLTFAIFGIAGGRLATRILTLDLSSVANIPPPPPGISLTEILANPIFGALLSSIPLTGGGGGGLDPTSLVTSLIQKLLPPLGINLAIFIVSAVGLGLVLDKFVEPKLQGRTEAIRLNLAKKLLRTPPKATKVAAIVLLVLTLSLLIQAPAAEAQATSFYSEAIAGFVIPDGTAGLFMNFMDSSMNLNGIDTHNPAFEGAQAAILIAINLDAGLPPFVRSLISSQLPSDLSATIESFLPIIPKVAFIVIYSDQVSASDAARRAASAAAQFSNAYNVPLTLLQTVSPGGEQGTVAIYSGDASFKDVSSSMIQSLPTTGTPPKPRGLMKVLDRAQRRGVIIPYPTPESNSRFSANGSMMLVGFVDPSDAFESAAPQIEDQIGEDAFTGLVGDVSGITRLPIITAFSYWLNRFHSSPAEEQSLDLADLLAYQETSEDPTVDFVFDATATVSLVAAVSPQATASTTELPSIEDMRISIITTAKLTPAIIAELSRVAPTVRMVSNVTAGTAVDLTSVTQTFIYPFPLQLRLIKTGVQLSENTFEITVTAINSDVNDTASNVRVDDSGLLKPYKGSAKLIAGQMTKDMGNIGPNSTDSFTYKIELLREGFYTAPRATATYQWAPPGDPLQTYETQSNSLSLLIKAAAAANLLGSGFNFLADLIGRSIGVPGLGSTILTVIIAAIVAILAFFEYRNFLKWLRKPSAAKKGPSVKFA